MPLDSASSISSSDCEEDGAPGSCGQAPLSSKGEYKLLLLEPGMQTSCGEVRAFMQLVQDVPSWATQKKQKVEEELSDEKIWAGVFGQ